MSMVHHCFLALSNAYLIVVYRCNRDTESGVYCIYQWLLYKFYIGSPLESLEADTMLYLKQMKALK
jgi:hypothetical protein